MGAEGFADGPLVERSGSRVLAGARLLVHRLVLARPIRAGAVDRAPGELDPVLSLACVAIHQVAVAVAGRVDAAGRENLLRRLKEGERRFGERCLFVRTEIDILSG